MFLPNSFPFLSESHSNSLIDNFSEDILSISSKNDIFNTRSFLPDLDSIDSPGIIELENDRKKHIFKTDKTELHNKRGRKINKESKKAEHTARYIDNITRKIQVHFLTFLVNLINDIISTIPHISISMKDLAYDMKCKVSKEYFEKMKKSSIKELFENINITSKYKKCDENTNKENIKKLIEYDYDYFSNLFEKDYLFLFRLYYNNGKPLAQLSLFGKTINISGKTETFYDLIQKYKELKFELIEVAKINFINDINKKESESEKGDDKGFNENEEINI
jgi:hypothetical protein